LSSVNSQADPFGILRPLRGQTLGAQAADAIRDLIAAGRFSSGDRLVEARIAEQLGISRGPVRDALRLLSQEGLVTDVPRRGTFVAELNEQDVREIYDLRIAVETAAVRLVMAKDDPDTLKRLSEATDDMRAATDAARAAEADLRFHATICEASGNSRLYDVFVRNATELLILLRLDEEEFSHEPVGTVGEHEQLLGVLAGDIATAEAAFRTHLEEARDRVAAYVRDQAKRLTSSTSSYHLTRLPTRARIFHRCVFGALSMATRSSASRSCTREAVSPGSAGYDSSASSIRARFCHVVYQNPQSRRIISAT
jgi:DNA-binding GntR family transcriptional regulator